MLLWQCFRLLCRSNQVLFEPDVILFPWSDCRCGCSCIGSWGSAVPSGSCWRGSCTLCCDCDSCWCGGSSCCSRCCARLVWSSAASGSPALAGVDVARPAMGPVESRRSVLGVVLLPLVVLIATGRGPIGLRIFRILPKMTEPRLLLPCLDVRLEVLLVILVPLRWVTARPVLALRAGGRGHLQERSGIAQVLAVVCPPRLQAWRTTIVLVPLMLWTSTGMTLSSLSWPSSGTSTAWKSRRVFLQFDARLLLLRSRG